MVSLNQNAPGVQAKVKNSIMNMNLNISLDAPHGGSRYTASPAFLIFPKPASRFSWGHWDKVENRGEKTTRPPLPLLYLSQENEVISNMDPERP